MELLITQRITFVTSMTEEVFKGLTFSFQKFTSRYSLFISRAVFLFVCLIDQIRLAAICYCPLKNISCIR